MGALGNRDFMSSPFSSQSFTKDFISNFQFRTAADVLITDPSVSTWSTANPLFDYVKFRGFPSYASADAAALNGLLGIVGNAPALSSLERIELIKGSNAFLNGNIGAVGGAVNYVTKRATDTPITSITGSFLSNSVLGGHLDVGRRFGEANEYGVRVNAYGRGGDVALHDASRRDRGASLGFDYRGDGFRFDADLLIDEQVRRGWNWDIGLAPGLALPKPPRASTLFQPPWMESYNQTKIGMARAEYDLTSNWTVGVAGGGFHTNSYYKGFCIASILNRAGDTSCMSFPRHFNTYGYAADGYLRGEFDTGPIKHRVSIGSTYYDDQQQRQPGLGINSIFQYNIYNPVFPPEVPLRLGATNKFSSSYTRSAYLSDTMSILDDRLQFTAGVRRVHIEQSSFNIENVARTGQTNAWATTPAFGLLVKLTPQLSLYGNVIEALERGGRAPVTAANAGQLFPALVSKQEEIGLKADFGTIGGSVALYRINKANQYVDARTNTFSQDGRQTNKGVEVNVFGEPIKGVRFITGAAAIDATLDKTSGGLYDGRTAPIVPSFEYRLATEIDVPWVSGLTLTGAVIHSGPAQFDNANTLKVPAWTRLDLGARYVWTVAGTRMTARLGVENITNKAYWISGLGAAGVQLSAPRTVAFSLTADLDFSRPGIFRN